jgi:nicotinate-nucleotide adenylyltransferase
LSEVRAAIFGGAFDPIHNAHLAVARAAAERFHLDRVLLIPNYRPPHKGGKTHAPYEDRLRMVEIACEELNRVGGTRFEASRLEDGSGSSYSIDTIHKVRAMLGPHDELFFIIGADAFADLRSWHRWRDVAQAVRFIVAARPDYCYDAPAEAKAERLDEINFTTSSSDLRNRIRSGDSKLDAPRGVIEYIRTRRLYTDTSN